MSKSLSLDKKEANLNHSAIEAQLSFLMGKVLTVVDAVIPAEVQNKAAKDLVRAAFREQQNYIGELCHGTADWNKAQSA